VSKPILDNISIGINGTTLETILVIIIIDHPMAMNRSTCG
jgi:hypothetical protein